MAAAATLGAAAVATDAAVESVTAPYPGTHLLDLPFSVPPHLFARRWVTLGTHTSAGTPCIERMLLDYTTARGEHERVWLTVHQPHDVWQRNVCPRDSSFRS